MDAETKQKMSSSKSEHWCTPPEFLDLVREVNIIALDPCSNIFSVVEPKKAVSPPQDALVLQWKDLLDEIPGGGLIFCNPPYGRGVKSWVKKCALEATQGCEIILLTAARTETQAFQDWIFPTADRCCLFRGRITFIDGTNPVKKRNPALFPSAVSYWGPTPEKFDEVFSDKGCLIDCTSRTKRIIV